ncbi:hypothetical protein Amet_3447 [Alkaliphilus metalliredigens QYMF]|uniref:Uncharacterized protein n=1 Tax=Alkaliphilus metalliredigens (strain QYMF) TaxID=293826 RepID=A6TTQ7_ALKMQ|nr:hypothetical protein [Alkaliphilus metalliredigens]ABR49575.1 hypothetical protein Amet_3447 [Alkaliphilus metalliredigens QYMF]
MGIRLCQCPERIADFINQEVVVNTICENEIVGTLEEVTDEYLELSGVDPNLGPTIIIILCCHICAVTVLQE